MVARMFDRMAPPIIFSNFIERRRAFSLWQHLRNP